MTTSDIASENEAAIAAYGSKTVAVEPGGVEHIPVEARHGKPSQLFWTWTSPNLEFATIAVGILGVLAFGLSFWESVLAIVIGTGLGAITQGLLSTWGPRSGLCQMVLSRRAFGFLGNILPAGLNAIVAGIGWFAVNSISAALALHALIPVLPSGVCLVIVVLAMMLIAFAGHNLIQAFERYAMPALAVIFVIGLFFIFSKAKLSAPAAGGVPGGFLIMVGATFGYAAGWNPYASDYTRYLPTKTAKRAVGLYAALGLFVSCVILEAAGSAMVTAVAKPGVDPGIYTSVMPEWLGKLTLLAITVGAVCANALNVYSGSMSFMAMGVKLPTQLARAAVAVVMSLIGLAVAFGGLGNAGASYEAFLLVIAYWIGPWVGVVLADRLLFKEENLMEQTSDTKFQNWAGPISMLAAMVISILLFSNQEKFVGLVVKGLPGLGDITFFIGFLIAFGLYVVLVRAMRPSTTSVRTPVKQN